MSETPTPRVILMDAAPQIKALSELLYRAVRELEYIQSAENCRSGLCATSEGKEIIEAGMTLLSVKDLAAEYLGKPDEAQKG